MHHPQARPRPRPLATPAELDPHPPVRGQRLLQWLERAFTRLVAWPRRYLEDRDNPLLQVGALANLALLVAMVSGILLLIWYTPSHEGAYASVEAMAESPLIAGLMRSLHRYSSDATLLLVLLHAIQMLVQRRLAGPRWLAWVTGFASVFFIWLIGWLGYWLVWDERAQLVAVGTAKALDVLPIFTDPLARTFLTDAGVSSLLFFVVFFVHMLLPLLMGIALWLHLARLSRPRWLPSKALALWALGAMVLLSLVLPASSAGPASMANHPQPTTIDAWYLLPLVLSDRLGGGLLWLVLLVSSGLLFGLPWWLVKRRREPLSAPAGPVAPVAPVLRGHDLPPQPAPSCAPAEPTHFDPVRLDAGHDTLRRAPVAVVDPARCNACETCYRDCPFDAIRMVPRSDGRRFPSVAWVDPARCIGCGVCVGSCDSSGVGPSWLMQPPERRRVDAWLATDPPDTSTIVFACARSGAAGLGYDPESGRIPGHANTRLLGMPCAAWLHPLTVERALRRGARKVVVISCRTGTCVNREGAQWTRERLEARREPTLRLEQVDTSKIERIEADPHELPVWSDEVVSVGEPEALAAKPGGASSVGGSPVRPRRPAGAKVPALLVGAALALALMALTWLPSELPYPAPDEGAPELVVSFKLAGNSRDRCRTRSPEELAALPPHKRTPEVCERSRGSVRLLVRVDGELAHESLHEPSGAFADGASTAIVKVPMNQGRYELEVALGDADPADPTGAALPHRSQRAESFVMGRRTVVVFDRLGGFVWH